MRWLKAITRVLLVTGLALGVGALYGYPLQVALLVLLLLIGFWLYQMQKVQDWLREPTGAPPDAYGVWGDLLARIYTRRRKNLESQQRLLSMVEYLESSFSSMRDGVVMVDDQDAIKWFNKSVGPLLGLLHPDDIGQVLTNLVRAPEFNAYFLQRDYSSPLQFSVGSDTHRLLQVEVTNFGDGDRLLFVRDVSADARLQLMRRDFVANVSHELRTPLTVINGYLKTLLDNVQEAPETYAKPLEQMSQQADRMEDLIKDLLWLSRIESDKYKSKSERIDIAGLLHELKEEIAEVYPEARLNLEITSDRKVYGSYRELYSAISNLITNAIKYSPDREPVSIVWTQEQQKGVLRVTDSGIGIDSAHIPRLTERFYRVDDSRVATTGGTGLGLAIVKHVAAAHSAELLISSKLGQGSCFTLVFSDGG